MRMKSIIGRRGLLAACTGLALTLAQHARSDLLAYYCDGTDIDAAALIDLAGHADATAGNLQAVGFQGGNYISSPSFGASTPAGPTAGSSTGSEWLFARASYVQTTPGTGTDYFGFTVTPDLAPLALFSLTFDWVIVSARNGSFDAQCQVFVSVDGGAFVGLTPISSDSITVPSGGPSHTFGSVNTIVTDLTGIGNPATSMVVRICLGDDSSRAGQAQFVQGIKLEGALAGTVADLTVSSDYGTPNPAVGLARYVTGTVVTASVDAAVTGVETQYVCTGWVGTEDVPASGTTNEAVFTMTTHSTIAWQWGTNYYLDLTVNPGGTTDVQTGWFASGSNVTVTATATNGGNAVWLGDTNGCMIAGDAITCPMTGPRAISLYFQPAGNVRLTVVSAHGGADPETGIPHFYASGSNVNAVVTNSPLTLGGTTQHVCYGWSRVGSEPGSGVGAGTSFAISNETTLTWQWQTDYYLDLTEYGSGTTDVHSGWIAAGSNVTITAYPDHGGVVTWAGDTGGCTITSNQISWTMGAARALSVGHPLPAGLRINEFMAINDSTLTNSLNELSDWIEIYNSTTGTVDLTGWHLTDNAGDLTKWTFPTTNLAADGYLLIYADGSATSVTNGELHASFKLSGDGEYLGLVKPDGLTVEHAYDPDYPSQSADISYGIGSLYELRYFDVPTPGQPNNAGFLPVKRPKFNYKRGIYTNAISVTLTSSTDGAQIRYTLDGTAPSSTYGALHTGAIDITNSTCLRAVAYKAGDYNPSAVKTHTYIFPLGVLQQDGAGWPATWAHTGVGDYEMDPAVVGDRSTEIVAGLQDLPTVSLALDPDDMFAAGGVGIYPQGEGIPRATSFEFFDPRTGESVQENCAVQVFGGTSVNRWKTDKLQFRLRFKEEYGATKLDYPVFGEDNAETFDNLVLDGRLANTWTYGGGVEPGSQRARAQFVRDSYIPDLQVSASGYGVHGRHVNLYIDGLYWGVYGFHERPDESFGASYFGGDREDYDVVKHTQDTVVHGSNTNYVEMINKAAAGLSTDVKYQEILQYVDPVHLADYMIVNYYSGHSDWGGLNWYVSRNRTGADKRWRYICWDAEHGIERLSDNNTGRNDAGRPTALHHDMADNAEYRLLFADRVHRHLFNDGTLTPSNAAATFRTRLDDVEQAVYAESARWGDNRKEPPYRKEVEWEAEKTRLFDTYFPARTAALLGQLSGQNLYPDVDAPVLSQHGGVFTNGYALSMTAADTIYYTLDGTDPREYGTGSPTGTVYVGPITLPYGLTVKARVRDGANTWSALTEALFVPESPPELWVTEVMYNPRAAAGSETNGGYSRSDFEFIELQNRGSGTIGLADLAFTDAITFDFADGDLQTLGAGEHVVVVKNLAAFKVRYPGWASLNIAGEFQRVFSFPVQTLADNGERVVLQNGQGSNLLSFTYNDARGWPLETDGAGHSLVPLVLTNGTDKVLDYSGNWRASAFMDGSPGTADPAPIQSVVINEVTAHTDTGQPPPNDSDDWIELHNPLSVAVDIGGWWLSDGDNDLMIYQIPTGTVMLAGEFLKLSENLHFHTNRLDGSGFGLDKAGERVYLTAMPGAPSNRVVDAVRFKAQENGPSLGRYPNGTGPWYTLVPTPAASNAMPGSHVLISQIMYHPEPTLANPENNTNDEYIEIYNPLGVPAPLWTNAGPWRIDGGIGYTFPSNTTLAAGERLMVVSFDPVADIGARDAFFDHYALTNGQVELLGPYSGQLDNQGDRVALERPLEADPPDTRVSWVIVDEVIYFDSSPWASGADAGGGPLFRTEPAGHGNEPANWALEPPGMDDFKVTGMSLSAGTPVVAWGGYTNGAWYVERSTNLTSGFSQIGTSMVATTYHDTGLPSSESTYYYRVTLKVMGATVPSRNVGGYTALTARSNAYSLVGNPFQKLAVYEGVATNNTATAITDGGASWAVGQYTAGVSGQEATGTSSFYVEIRDSENAFYGKRFSIASNSTTELWIDGGAAAGLTNGALVDADYAIVPEQRIRDIFGEPGSPLLAGGDGLLNADNVLFWSGGSWERIYHNGAFGPPPVRNHWLLGSTVVDDRPVLRDSGFFVLRRSSSDVHLGVTGEVSSNDQWIDLNAGYNLVGGGWLTSVAIVDTGLEGVIGGGTRSSTAPTILEWSGSSWEAPVFYKTGGGPPWLVGSWVRGSTAVDDTFVLEPNRGYFIESTTNTVWRKERP